MKAELIYWNKYETKEQAKDPLFEYIENFYNIHRRHSTLGNLTIEEFQNQHPVTK
ncbi:IS3 family transposase [Flavobacterium sp. JAS]|uniref:IS3 family transposase n=1 Tax=Flavobacterium sp. JAS TaxID=2897329 RepID=UPI001E29F912|nr:IS3 family transposase [Flavobacterium sp. JAS]MCD0468737.1 IS3 family transposase [Flavobacterium sp. JAS]